MNHNQKQIQRVIEDKINNPVDHEDFPNIIRMKVSSENEETQYINLSLTQLKKIQEILKSVYTNYILKTEWVRHIHIHSICNI